MKTLLINILFVLVFFAQDRVKVTSVFVHGLNANDSFWGELPDKIYEGTAISNTLRINYGDMKMNNRSIESLTEEFREELLFKEATGYLRNKIIFVGHSLGGVIIRNFLLKYPEYRDRVVALITISSPHQGAPGAATPAKEFHDRLTGHFENIAVAEIYLRFGFFDFALGIINSVSFNQINNLIENLVGKGSYETINSAANIGTLYEELTPRSIQLLELNSDANKQKLSHIPTYTISGDEKDPMFFRVVGNGVEVKPELKMLFFKLFGTDIGGEKKAKELYYSRRNKYDSKLGVWGWFTGTNSVYRAGRNSIKGLNNAYTKLVRAYRQDFKTGTLWKACDNYFDEEEARDSDLKISLFANVSERAPTCKDGYWENYSYTITIPFRHDGFVPTWHTQINPVDDPNSQEAEIANHFNFNYTNHTQSLRYEGFGKKEGQTDESYQTTATYDKLLEIIKNKVEEEKN